MTALMWLGAALACLSAALAVWTATSPAGLSSMRGLFGRLRVRMDGLGRGGAVAKGPPGMTGPVGKLLSRLGRATRVGVRRGGEARARSRDRSRCLDELPELIDVVALGMSAGISFDAALGIYCDKYDTMLAGELSDAMRSWELGLTTRSEALHVLAGRLDVPAFTTFVDTATESLAFGAPLTKALGEQAQAVRRARRADVQERIEKAPIKMLVPTGTLILPAMLLAVLGPLLASLSELTG